MADKEKLASERLQLSVRKKKLELTVTNEETIDPNISKGDDQVPASPMVDYLFKIVLIGDAVSLLYIKMMSFFISQQDGDLQSQAQKA